MTRIVSIQLSFDALTTVFISQLVLQQKKI